MEDIVELSSDSNDTIIVPINENSAGFYDLSILEEKEPETKNEGTQEMLKTKNQKYTEVFEPEKLPKHAIASMSHKTNSVLDDTDNLLKELYAKYLPNRIDTAPKSPNKRNSSDNHNEPICCVDIDSENFSGQISDESVALKANGNVNNADRLLKELGAKYLPSETEPTKNNVNIMDCLSTHNNQNQHLKRKILNGEDEQYGSIQKVTKKQILEQERQKRKLEQQNKKEIMEQENALKKSLKNIQKSINPEECLKNIIVKIDETLEVEFGESINEKLTCNEISFKYVKQAFDGIISWTTKIQTIETLVGQIPTLDERHYLLVLPSKEFKLLVQTNNLNTHIHSISQLLNFQHLTIAVFGLDKLNDEQEYAVMECEMFFKCYWQFVKKNDDLSSLIFTITKAVAQIPYKLEKQEKYILQNEYFADSNKDTVRVDKNGNGLARLWNQMLTMLPLARLETAEAIRSVYPTPSSLFKAYEECISDKEGLIQNLQIRRANGPLATGRKIGPELSKKCANFFTSTENIYI